jgi:hypothetical protein
MHIQTINQKIRRETKGAWHPALASLLFVKNLSVKLTNKFWNLEKSLKLTVKQRGAPSFPHPGPVLA